MTLRLPGNGNMGSVNIVIGQVIGIHISDDSLTKDGRVDILKLRPIARLGYYEYSSIQEKFEMVIPGDNEELQRGMEGKQS